MKQGHIAMQMPLVKLCCCLFLILTLVACRNSASSDNPSTSSASGTQSNSASTSSETSDDGSGSAPQQSAGRNDEVCRKYDSCGCQKYDQCIAELENNATVDNPGARECLLKSSCQSLCAGQPDGCSKTDTGTTGPQQPNCTAIPCSKNSDCPSNCYGGCDGVICYSF